MRSKGSGEGSGGKSGRHKVRRHLNLSTRIIERDWISNLRPLFVSAPVSPCIAPRLIKISNKKHRESKPSLEPGGRDPSDERAKKRCCISPLLNDHLGIDLKSDGKKRMELGATFTRARQSLVQASIPCTAVAHPVGGDANYIWGCSTPCAQAVRKQ